MTRSAVIRGAAGNRCKTSGVLSEVFSHR